MKQNRGLTQRRSRWTEGDARLVLGDLERSGLELKAFARTRGLSAQRIRVWQGRLAVQSSTPAPPASGSDLRMVELMPAVTPITVPVSGRLHLRCPSGHTIELIDVDPARGLAVILAALRETAC